MAQPASADGPAAGKPDPDVRRALAFQAEACAKSVAELAARPDDDAALEMARLCLSVLQYLGERAFRREVDDAFIEAERARAVAEDRAAWPRPRGHLRALT